MFADLSALEVILVVSTLLEFNPLFQAIKAVRTKSVEDVSIWTFVSIFTIGALWLYYGITIASAPLIIGNTIKLLTGLMVVMLYLKYKKKASSPSCLGS